LLFLYTFIVLLYIHLGLGVYIRWNGMVEWNSGLDYWNGGMLHSTYLIIQHVLYSEQYLITGNIRVCCDRGCQQKYSKPDLPPHNLCVRHKEWQSFGPMMFTSAVTYPTATHSPKRGCSALTCPH